MLDAGVLRSDTDRERPPSNWIRCGMWHARFSNWEQRDSIETSGRNACQKLLAAPGEVGASWWSRDPRRMDAWGTRRPSRFTLLVTIAVMGSLQSESLNHVRVYTATGAEKGVITHTFREFFNDLPALTLQGTRRLLLTVNNCSDCPSRLYSVWMNKLNRIAPQVLNSCQLVCYSLLTTQLQPFWQAALWDCVVSKE